MWTLSIVTVDYVSPGLCYLLFTSFPLPLLPLIVLTSVLHEIRGQAPPAWQGAPHGWPQMSRGKGQGWRHFGISPVTWQGPRWQCRWHVWRPHGKGLRHGRPQEMSVKWQGMCWRSLKYKASTSHIATAPSNWALTSFSSKGHQHDQIRKTLTSKSNHNNKGWRKKNPEVYRCRCQLSITSPCLNNTLH